MYCTTYRSPSVGGRGGGGEPAEAAAAKAAPPLFARVVQVQGVLVRIGVGSTIYDQDFIRTTIENSMTHLARFSDCMIMYSHDSDALSRERMRARNVG